MSSNHTLASSRIAVLGYGSQGRAHALNLRDSGLDVVIGLRPNGPTSLKARADGFTVLEPAEAVKGADLVAVLTPDMVQPALYRESIEPNIKPGAALLFAHGFNVHFRQIEPREDIDVILVAPKGPGALVRSEYERGRGVPCIWAVHQDVSGQAEAKTKGYADGIGGGRAMIIKTDFKEETETDLFGEQAVLCGGASELATKGFDDPGRGRLPAGDRLLRGDARAEADRRPVLRGRPGEDAAVRLRDRAVRRLRQRPAGDRCRREGAHEGGADRHPGRHLCPQLDGRVRRRSAELPQAQAGRPSSIRSSGSARSLRAQMRVGRSSRNRASWSSTSTATPASA
ncbi:Ketol-acid reductoisomerase (NADP(+)) [Rhodanobacter lindaniclasticus]